MIGNARCAPACRHVGVRSQTCVSIQLAGLHHTYPRDRQRIARLEASAAAGSNVEADPERQRLWAGDSPDTEVAPFIILLKASHCMGCSIAQQKSACAVSNSGTDLVEQPLQCSGGESEASHLPHPHTTDFAMTSACIVCRVLLYQPSKHDTFHVAGFECVYSDFQSASLRLFHSIAFVHIAKQLCPGSVTVACCRQVQC
jgi:hypothetical protein